MRVLGRHALVLILDGRVFYEDGEGRAATLRPGDAILVDPQLAHAYGGENGQRWGQLYVVFEGPQFRLLEESPTFRSHLPLWHLDPVDLWRRRLEDCLRPERRQVPAEALRTVADFSHLLVEMAAADADAREHPSEAWLEKSLQLLGTPQAGQWLSPQTVARLVGKSYEAFRKRFASHTGQSPAQFQKRRRIDQACAAIYQGDENFKELAERLGFCDVYHFSKVFRQVIGQPPAAYRRSVRGG